MFFQHNYVFYWSKNIIQAVVDLFSKAQNIPCDCQSSSTLIFSPRLTIWKFFLAHLVPSEESRYRYHEVPEQKPGQLQENGMMLRDVSHDIIEDLANFLNPMSPPSNWRKVASMLDFPWSVINNLALCPTSATQQLLERWGTKRGSTVYKLYLTLKDIGRDDAAEVLERLLVQPAPSCPRSM